MNQANSPSAPRARWANSAAAAAPGAMTLRRLFASAAGATARLRSCGTAFLTPFLNTGRTCYRMA